MLFGEMQSLSTLNNTTVRTGDSEFVGSLGRTPHPRSNNIAIELVKRDHGQPVIVHPLINASRWR